MNAWKRDFFTQLHELARSRDSFIYNPNKVIKPKTKRLEKKTGLLNHTTWDITEGYALLHFCTAKAMSSPEGLQEKKENEFRFKRLLSFKSEIEKVFGFPIEWERGPTNRSVVSWVSVAASDSNQSDWPRIQNDLLDRFERLRTVLTQFPPFTAAPPAGKIVPASIACRARLPAAGEKAITQLQSLASNIYPDEISDDATFQEGKRKTVTVDAYERNPQARKKCIRHYGTVCYVCGFDFGRVYGPKGQGIIHVHHITPISEVNGPHQIDPINDLRPVCPNCHTMLHASTPVMEIEALKTLLQRS